MSNPAPTPQAPAESQAAPEAPPTGETPDAKVLTPEELVEANRAKNAEAKNLRDRLKAAEEQRDALQAAADAAKPAEQLEAERVQALEAEKASLAQELGELKRERLISQVQKATGLPDGLVDRLRGETAEELTADAKALVALIPPAAPTPPVPAPNPGQLLASGSAASDRQAQAKAFLATVPGMTD